MLRYAIVPLFVFASLFGCSNGSSVPSCSGTSTVCNGACSDLMVDRENCGACGMTCGASQVCTAGKCANACGAGTSLCGDGKCHDLSNDNANCGACSAAGLTNKACATGTVCSMGQCGATCAGGTLLCGDGKCHDVMSDNANCGACSTAGTTDKACAAGNVCSAGQCAATCAGGTTLCTDGKCHDLMNDNANCGACSTAGDKACATGTVCSSGQCAATCAGGATLCGDGKCHDLTNDNANCGACSTAGTLDKACAAGSVCSSGSCAPGCAGGTTLCGDGKCHDLTTDNANCGACSTAGTTDKACTMNTVCGNGVCVSACGNGQVCGGVCVNPQTDPMNCGGCGKACPMSQVCIGGNCALRGPPYPSYASPGGTATTSAHFQDMDFAFAAPGPSMIYYTTDGSAPVPGMGTTKSSANPLLLTSVAGAGMGTTIRWYADYGAGGGPELDVHSLVVTTTAPGNSLGAMVQHVQFTSGFGPVILVAPGATVTGQVDYQVWRSNANGYCPGCVVQWVLGVDGVGQVACINNTFGTYPGQTGTQTFSFTAPMAPGRYPMRHGQNLQYSCQAAGYPGGEEVGEVIVSN
jgi:hypothetical protein